MREGDAFQESGTSKSTGTRRKSMRRHLRNTAAWLRSILWIVGFSENLSEASKFSEMLVPNVLFNDGNQKVYSVDVNSVPGIYKFSVLNILSIFFQRNTLVVFTRILLRAHLLCWWSQGLSQVRSSHRRRPHWNTHWWNVHQPIFEWYEDTILEPLSKFG